MEIKLAQLREAHAVREREIVELTEEQDCLGQFSTQFLGSTRDFANRTHAELEAHPGCSSSQHH